MFTLTDVLEREGLAAGDVTAMPHSPRQRALMAVLPSLVRTRPAAMEAYQATPSAGAEATLGAGRPWVASFVKVGQDVPSSHSRMLFAGLNGNAGSRVRSRADIMADPEIDFLQDTCGTNGEFSGRSEEEIHTWFDLTLTDLAAMQGRLVVTVRLTPNCVRLAENLDAPIRANHKTSSFDATPPDWRVWVLSAAELRALPLPWAARLREWRGVYLITDRTDDARYVGCAYGKGNPLGRWLMHVSGEAGVTAGLAARDPATFDFNILERVSPDMDIGTIPPLEQGWMRRLHTRTHGLNA